MLANSSDEDGETEFVDIFNVHLIRNNTHVRKKAMMKKSPSKKVNDVQNVVKLYTVHRSVQMDQKAKHEKKFKKSKPMLP